MTKKKDLNCQGTYFDKKNQRWFSEIIVNKKRYWVGSFKSKVEAHDAWEKKRDELYENYKVIDLPGEEWRSMVNHKGNYWVSNKGRIKNLNYEGLEIERLLSFYDSHGYCGVNINRTKFVVHRIVAQYFLGENELFINHKDGNKKNNNVENLEYVSMRGNMCHRYYILNDRDNIGAHWDKDWNKWRAEICINKKLIYLGHFDSKEEASNRYFSALLEYGFYDDYAYLIELLSLKQLIK